MHRASMTGCSCASLSAPLFQPCVNKDVICSTGDAPCLGSAGEHHACPSLPELLLSLQQLGHPTGISGGHGVWCFVYGAELEPCPTELVAMKGAVLS